MDQGVCVCYSHSRSLLRHHSHRSDKPVCPHRTLWIAATKPLIFGKLTLFQHIRCGIAYSTMIGQALSSFSNYSSIHGAAIHG
ncbi:MAG TPA: hypothetical protein VFX10_01575, partial [Nitrospira sp.]|nr:hypothetical protein [Nitrospira sp.]